MKQVIHEFDISKDSEYQPIIVDVPKDEAIIFIPLLNICCNQMTSEQNPLYIDYTFPDGTPATVEPLNNYFASFKDPNGVFYYASAYMISVSFEVTCTIHTGFTRLEKVGNRNKQVFHPYVFNGVIFRPVKSLVSNVDNPTPKITEVKFWQSNNSKLTSDDLVVQNSIQIHNTTLNETQLQALLGLIETPESESESTPEE